jgi:hypothetical protein
MQHVDISGLRVLSTISQGLRENKWMVKGDEMEMQRFYANLTLRCLSRLHLTISLRHKELNGLELPATDLLTAILRIKLISRIQGEIACNLQYCFGPSVLLRSVGYGATECRVSFAYGAKDTDLYRLVSNSYIEFLDVEKQNAPANLVHPVRDLLLESRAFSSGRLRWARSTKFSAMDCGGTSLITSSRSMISLLQRGFRSFGTSSAKGTQHIFT